IISGCVPLNIFDGAGSVTRQQLDYMSPRPIVDRGINGQRIAQAIAQGPAGQLWGRDLRWAFGAEYRRESGSLIGDPLRTLVYQSLLDPARPGGAFAAGELFTEGQLPLPGSVSGRTGSLTAGLRWSDFPAFGSKTSWEAGVRWPLTSQ